MVPQSNKIYPKMVAPKSWGAYVPLSKAKQSQEMPPLPKEEAPKINQISSQASKVLEDCLSLNVYLEPTKCNLSQSQDTVVFVWNWRNTGVPSLPTDWHISAEWVNGFGGFVGVVLNGEAVRSTLAIIEPENGAKFKAFKIRLSSDRQSVSLHVTKGEADIWSHAYMGRKQDKMTLLTFPETGIVRSSALLMRGGRESGRRAQIKKTHSLDECRPMTLLYRSHTFAVVDIADVDPPVVSLTVLTTEDSMSPGSESLTSSPDIRVNDRSLRPRSYSTSAVHVKGILKHGARSMTQCSDDDLSMCSDILDEVADADTFSKSYPQQSHTKRVTFDARVLQHSFRTNSSILGQKKKNQKRDKNRTRRNSTDDSSQGSCSESEEQYLGMSPFSEGLAPPCEQSCPTIDESVEETKAEEENCNKVSPLSVKDSNLSNKNKRKGKKRTQQSNKYNAQQIVRDKYAGLCLGVKTGDSTDSGIGLENQSQEEDRNSSDQEDIDRDMVKSLKEPIECKMVDEPWTSVESRRKKWRKGSKQTPFEE